ncbi:Phospholipid-transporting ATPase [Hondaea fermentalgiana]|uniref:P-type phospholipid transporter n=1 Tax=Hondaea fermentalgiana TaxID=2315210 RepID=A0A2R5GAT2_9STRA|nr:Phospholipid-transporting ATPase [Hondaea fermentalgiana]|eukprot:GBG27705.1 Phospholipid-transporting ATPase [Hondaea fermentalgiana]
MAGAGEGADDARRGQEQPLADAQGPPEEASADRPGPGTEPTTDREADAAETEEDDNLTIGHSDHEDDGEELENGDGDGGGGGGAREDEGHQGSSGGDGDGDHDGERPMLEEAFGGRHGDQSAKDSRAQLDPELQNEAIKPTSMDDLEDEEDDQATPDTLDPYARWLRILGFTMSKTVPQPGKGEKVELIQLRVPFTSTFVRQQAKRGCNERLSNTTRTAKYNIWTFFPRAAGHQFLRYTNAFYLFIAIIALIGYFGENLWTVSFNPVTIIALLIVVVGVALIFEGLDDWRRHSGDRETNNATVSRIRKGEIEETTWGELVPGDLVYVNDRESVPADIVLLASYGADAKGSTCYIETSGIDGETNLKIKEVPKFMTASLFRNVEARESLQSSRMTSKRMSSYMSTPEVQLHEKQRLARIIPTLCAGLYEYEQPNVFMQFNATFVPRSSFNGDPLENPPSENDKKSLDFKNLILRGSQLRNTKWIVGLVVYAGPETKLALSRRPSPAKFGRIDTFMNRILAVVTVIMIVLIIFADVLLFTTTPDTATMWYFQYTSSTVDAFTTPGPLAYLFTFLILFSNIIPIPIIIIVEILNFYAQAVIQWDLELYHDKTDTAASCRTSNLVAEIGQITHVFSDKTGTLTRNQMKMIGCWVDGKMYGHQPPPPDKSEMENVGGASSKSGNDGEKDDPAAPKSFSSEDKQALEAIVEQEVADRNSGRIPSSPVSIPEELSNSINGSSKRNSGGFEDLELGNGGSTTKRHADDDAGDSTDIDDDASGRNLGSEDNFGCDDVDDDTNSEASMKSIDVEEVFQDAIGLLQENSNTDEHRAVLDFFVLLAVCHTVVLDWDEHGEPVLNAESPDEEAFVRAAGVCGVDLQSTSDGRIVIKTPHFEDEYKVLAVNPFNSSRKRMSLVLNRTSDNSIVLMMKGADNMMLERLAPDEMEKVEELSEALTRYSWNGLRTLVMGKRELTPDEYEEWHETYKSALVAKSSERAGALAKAAEMVERDVVLVGASAVEDQLQLGVPQAIKTLRDAGTQVWVLTGDKVETAINIGLSSNLLDSSMFQLKLIGDDVHHLESQLDEILDVLQQATDGVDLNWDRFHTSSHIQRHLTLDERDGAQNTESVFGSTMSKMKSCLVSFARPFREFRRFMHNFLQARSTNKQFQANVALIVSGNALEQLLHEQKGSIELQQKLLYAARACKVVLACRVSPAQKSLIVEMVRYAPDVKQLPTPPVTLAIGDGANDVPMIQAAHVGIGISGMEGRQAVNSSDFAIAQFRFLVRLMLVHGRWTYRRQANLINYIVYSWLVYTGLLFMYLPYSLYSGQQIFYETLYTSFFAYFANVAVVAHGWFERDLTPQTVMRNPWVYSVGVNSNDLNFKKLGAVTFVSFLHILLLFGFLFSVLPSTVPLDILGSAMFVGLIMILYTRQALVGSTYVSITVGIFILDLMCFFIVMASIQSPPIIYTESEGAGMIWSAVVLCMMSVVVFDSTVRISRKEFFPHPEQVLQELDRGYFKGSKHARHSHQDAFLVLEDFGRLTALPFAIATQRIGNIIEKRELAQRQKDMESIGSISQLDMVERSLSAPASAHLVASRFSEDSTMMGERANSSIAHPTSQSAFQRMTPAFDFDFSTFGSDVRASFRRMGANARAPSLRSASAGNRVPPSVNEEDADPLPHTDSESSHVDNDAYMTSARRFDLQKFFPFARKKGSLEEIAELEETEENGGGDESPSPVEAQAHSSDELGGNEEKDNHKNEDGDDGSLPSPPTLESSAHGNITEEEVPQEHQSEESQNEQNKQAVDDEKTRQG